MFLFTSILQLQSDSKLKIDYLNSIPLLCDDISKLCQINGLIFNTHVHSTKTIEGFQNHKSNQLFFSSSIANNITLGYQKNHNGGRKKEKRTTMIVFAFIAFAFTIQQ